MVQLECSPTEDIVRAIRSSDWDPKNNRFSSNLFRGPKASVGRLVIYSLNKLFRIFHRDLDRPYKLPPDMVKWGGEINIGVLKNIGSNHTEKPTEITVELSPYRFNRAHAEIIQQLSRGLCHKIISSLKIHNDVYINSKYERLYFILFGFQRFLLIFLKKLYGISQ